MSQPEQHQEQNPSGGDGYADAFAAIAIIAIVVSTVVFWLKSL